MKREIAVLMIIATLAGCSSPQSFPRRANRVPSEPQVVTYPDRPIHEEGESFVEYLLRHKMFPSVRPEQVASWKSWIEKDSSNASSFTFRVEFELKGERQRQRFDLHSIATSGWGVIRGVTWDGGIEGNDLPLPGLDNQIKANKSIRKH